MARISTSGSPWAIVFLGTVVTGFVLLAITSIAVGIRAGDGVASAAGLLGIVVAGLCVVAAGVTISRGVLARPPLAGPLLAVRAPLVGAAAGPDNEAKAARIERQELAVFGLMLERAGGDA